jgi:hypothetical protein
LVAVMTLIAFSSKSPATLSEVSTLELMMLESHDLSPIAYEPMLETTKQNLP